VVDAAAPRVTALVLAAALLACPGRGTKLGVRAPGDRGAPIELVLPALDGGEIDLASHRGKVVVVHFFTTWSLASQIDIAELQRARAAASPDEVVVVGVGLDPNGYALIAPWRDATGADYVIALPTQEVRSGTSSFGAVVRVPMTVVLDRAGRPAWRHADGLPRGVLAEVVRSLVAEGARP
jgi:hypothetical protein